jgi:small GTP-binding protein
MSRPKKIVLIGHFGVGKTSLIRRFVENTFTKDYKVTIGVHISKKEIHIKGDTPLTLVIWDLEGLDDITKMRTSYLLGTNGFIYVFDLSRPVTYENLEAELKYLKTNYPNTPTKVVGNKMDLVNKAFIEENNGIFTPFVDYYVSAKLGSRVETLFTKLAEALI